jgi:AcrR family transcriptional regulator
MTETAGRRDRRADRHAATKREIVDAAWGLARERGLAGWTLRDVAEAVGMRAPSLYGYFDSKFAIYDAMFADGYTELLTHIDAVVDPAASPIETFRASGPLFFDFCVEDPARYQLLFLRTIPGFEPGQASYAMAREVLERLTQLLAAVGAGGQEDVDLWTAVVTGLAGQQVSNDPGGDRWRRLVAPAAEMFLAVRAPAMPHDGGSGGPPPTIGG